MANLEQIVSRKAENDTKWKEAQQAERENTTAMQDAGITEITSNPEAYARYLEMQGDNPSYSAGNIALVMFGNPEATVFGTRDRWKTLSRSVMDSEKNNGVKIFARSPMGRGYTLADAYDIKQTQGRDISRITLQNDSKEMEAALTTVLNYAVVPVVIDKELPAPAFYDSANLELAINPDYPDNEAFAAITAEVAHSRFHAKGANSSYDRSECELDAHTGLNGLCRICRTSLLSMRAGNRRSADRLSIIFRIPVSSLGAPLRKIWRWANSAAVPRYIVLPGKVPTTGGVSPLGSMSHRPPLSRPHDCWRNHARSQPVRALAEP